MYTVNLEEHEYVQRRNKNHTEIPGHLSVQSCRNSWGGENCSLCLFGIAWEAFGLKYI